MTAPRIAMPDGKPEFGTVFFVYRAKVDTGSIIGVCFKSLFLLTALSNCLKPV